MLCLLYPECFRWQKFVVLECRKKDKTAVYLLSTILFPFKVITSLQVH